MNDIRQKLNEFARKYPSYVSERKVIQFPIMDELLHQYSILFPNQLNHTTLHPDGTQPRNFSIIPLSTLFQLTNFVNNFPYSHQFAQMSETQTQFSLLVSPLLKLTGHFIREQHTYQTLQTCNFYVGEQQEQADRVLYKLVAFIVEDIFKYKMNLLKPIDIVKSKQILDEIKKEKKTQKQKMSLLQMVEQQQEDNETEMKQEDLTLLSQKYEFENYLDPTCSNFWKIVYEAFNKLIKKSQKASRQQENEAEDQSEEEIDKEKVEVNIDNIETRRNQILREFQLLNKQKEQNKKKQKQSKSISYIKSFKIKEKFTELETKRFNNLINFLTKSWTPLLLQAIKLPYVQTLFTDLQLELIKKINDDDSGYFKFGMKEKVQLMIALTEVAAETDSFKTIIEYRQEIVASIAMFYDSVQSELNNINRSLQKNEREFSINDQQKYRKIVKQYLQLTEFDKLFINGCQYLGQDVQDTSYYLFSNELDAIYFQREQQWKKLEKNQFEPLIKSLNTCGVKELQLSEMFQKLKACELLNDSETSQFLKYDAINQNNETSKGYNKPIQIIVKTLTDMFTLITECLMIKHLRWDTYIIRQSTMNLIKSSDDIIQISQMIKIFIDSIEQVDELKIDTTKLQNPSKQDEKELSNMSEKLKHYRIKGIRINRPEDILFNDLEIFEQMEIRGYIIPTGQKVHTKFWVQTLGIEVKEALSQFAAKISKNGYYDLLFLSNVLLLAAQEYQIVAVQDQVKELEELKVIAKEIEKEEKNKRRLVNQQQIQSSKCPVVDLD